MYVQCMREELRDVCECDCVGSSATERTFHRASIRLITYTTEPCGNAGFYCVYVYPCLACMILFFVCDASFVYCTILIFTCCFLSSCLILSLARAQTTFFFSTFSPVCVCMVCIGKFS